ncbi:hypothetical protein [Thermococcus sp.]|uniref:hypothetical protein n=1 Tax=Thermococcus sp. TaxID=35749 RepID=UPI00261ADB67|nr:hypothetical protein [Thermococcus sp.]
MDTLLIIRFLGNLGLSQDEVERIIHNNKVKNLLEKILFKYRLLSSDGYQLKLNGSRREVSLEQVLENLDRILDAFIFIKTQIPMMPDERRLFYSMLSFLSLDEAQLTVIIRDQYIKRILEIAHALLKVEREIDKIAQILKDYELINRLMLLGAEYLPQYAGTVSFDELLKRAGCIVSALNFLIYREKYLDILDKVYESSTSVLWSDEGIQDAELKEILIKIVRASKQKRDKLKNCISTNADPAVLILEAFTNGCSVFSDFITSSNQERKETSRIYREFIQPYEVIVRRKVVLIEEMLKNESSLQFLNLSSNGLEELKTLAKRINSELSTVNLYPWEFPYALKKIDQARNTICENLRRSVKSRGNDVFSLCTGLKYVADLCGNSLDITIVLKSLRS